jgi:protease IV
VGGFVRFVVKALIGLLALLGLLIVLAVGAVALIGTHFARPPAPSIPQSVILELDLRRGVVENRPEGLLARATGTKVPLIADVVEAVERGAKDGRVKAVVARLGGASLGLAEAEEIRAALDIFSKSGKPSFVYAESLGEEGSGGADYFLASGFGEIMLQPSGEVGIAGVLMETPYLKDLLDKLGIAPRLAGRKEYKGAIYTLTESAMPEPQRENMQRLADSLVDQLADGIARGRKMTKDAARALIDRGPYLAKDALDAKLVDRLAYWDEAEDAITKKIGAEASDIAPAVYLRGLGSPPAGAPTIALIRGNGPIDQGLADDNPLSSEAHIGAERIAQAIRDASDDETVQAIVFRINSPGGSYVASDTIWREVAKAKAAGKPVVVSMGDVAASGGYFIAAPATAIVADPATLTGSIGVFSGKIVLADMWKKIGVNWGEVSAGKNAGEWSANQDFTAEGWARLQRSLDIVYADFTGKVAEGRKLDKAAVEAIAGGRIWTGADAKGVGLVDELGGLSTAIARARSEAKIAEGSEIQIAEFPKPEDPFKQILDQLFDEVSAQSSLSTSLRAIQPYVEMFGPLAGGAEGADQRLLSPPIAVGP